MENTQEKQVEEILLYELVPESEVNTNDMSDERAFERDINTSSSDEEVDHEFTIAKAWRLESFIFANADIIPFQQ